MQIVAQGVILPSVTRLASSRQVLWIQTHLYLADLNGAVAFGLHHFKENPNNRPLFLFAVDGTVKISSSPFCIKIESNKRFHDDEESAVRSGVAECGIVDRLCDRWWRSSR